MCASEERREGFNILITRTRAGQGPQGWESMSKPFGSKKKKKKITSQLYLTLLIDKLTE